MHPYTDILLNIIKGHPSDRESFLQAKKKAAALFHLPPPDNAKLITEYKHLLARQKIQQDPLLEEILKRRTIRTASGIACVTVMTRQYRCPGRCVFCPQVAGMPKSYLPDQPAMMRAIRNKFDPYNQVKSRLEGLHNNGHNTEKIEIRIAGETWSAYPKRYQTWFIKRIFDALNKETSKTLLQAQKRNETAMHRCVGMSIETRPDWIHAQEIERLRWLGVTLVELGVQHLDNSVLLLNHRDHPVETTIAATKLLRDAGFKVVYHTMPNLLGSNPSMDVQMHKDLFEQQNFRPDQLKIYPCLLLQNTVLSHWYEQGKYQPYTTDQLIDILVQIKRHIPEYCRIIRIARDIPSGNIISGNKVTNIRQLIHQHPEYSCRCIRCREPMEKNFTALHPVFKVLEYEANEGKEYFICSESKDGKTLYGYVRLRLKSSSQHFIHELKGAALIRELHVYGMVVPLDTKDNFHVQHKGLGMRLMKKAEEIAAEKGYKKIAVISGIGVRRYYEEKLEYHLEGTYMIKYINQFKRR